MVGHNVASSRIFIVRFKTILHILWNVSVAFIILKYYCTKYELLPEHSSFVLCVWFLPGRGMGMPGSGTLNGGTMTGGNAGMAAVGWATL